MIEKLCLSESVGSYAGESSWLRSQNITLFGCGQSPPHARARVVSAGQGGVLGLVRQGYLGLYM